MSTTDEDGNFDTSVGNDTLDLFNVLDETGVSQNSSIDDPLRLSSMSTINSFHVPSTTSTPSKPKRERFKLPNIPPVYFKKCLTCGRGLKTEKGFNNHVLVHKWKEAAKEMPNLEYLYEDTLEKSKEIVRNLCTKKSVEDLATKVEPLVDSEEWNDFVKKLFEVAEDALEVTVSYGVTFPSTLKGVFQEHFSDFVSCKRWRREVIDKLQCVVGTSVTKWLFVFELLKQLLDATLTFVFKALNVNTLNQCIPHAKDDHSHHITQQVIHHVAGAAIRGCVRHTRRYPNNKRLRRREDCILSKFTTLGSPHALNEKDPKYWTSVLNRKSLYFINGDAFPFFLHLCEFLMSCETAYGPIGHEKVMEKLVQQKTVLRVWDSVVKDSLNEEESFSFMVKVIRTINNTYGKGVMMRRMNKAIKTTKKNKGTISVSHRARLM